MNMTASRAAEELQTAFCGKERFPNVSGILGSDWLRFPCDTPEQYREAAYAAATRKFGELPYYWSEE